MADKPVVCWCLDGLLDGGVDDIVVVLGATGRKVAAAITNYPLKIAWNANPSSDMAGSVKAGLKALPDRTTSVLILPVDHPLVAPHTVQALVETHREAPERITIPVYNGRKGHPVIFPRPVVAELSSLPTLRDIVRKDSGRVRLLEVDDEGILVNLNTPDDLRNIQTGKAIQSVGAHE